MPDREKIIKDLEIVKNDIRERFVSGSQIAVDTMRIDKAIVLLKEQQQRIEKLEIDIDILVKDINTNNCNTCKRECEHRPRLGEVVRVNCFLWEGT